jgi:hypothetical protein
MALWLLYWHYMVNSVATVQYLVITVSDPKQFDNIMFTNSCAKCRQQNEHKVWSCSNLCWQIASFVPGKKIPVSWNKSSAESTNRGFDKPYTIPCYQLTASNKEDEAIKDDGEDQNTGINKYSPELEGNHVQNELIHSCLSNSRV